MKKINDKLGTDYDLFNYYGAADADRVIVAMGSICDVAEEVIDYLTAKEKKLVLSKFVYTVLGYQTAFLKFFLRQLRRLPYLTVQKSLVHSEIRYTSM